MSFPDVLKHEYVLITVDLYEVGQYLGHEWNDVSDALLAGGFYSEDGEGSTTVQRLGPNGGTYASIPLLHEIFTALFAQHPQVPSIRVVYES